MPQIVNPFSLSFGKEPKNHINRKLDNQEIIKSFLSDNPSANVCMITGVRGSGKTVTLTNIANKIKKEKNWIVINLNPERDLLTSLTAELGNTQELFQLFKDAKINLSFFGFGLEIDGVPPITDIVVALRKMLIKITNSKRKVLITIDEVTPSVNFKQFASQFQIFIREGIDIFLLMSGLYENIEKLQNDKTQTFLYRSPKLELAPLNTILMANSYQNLLNIDEKESMEMAKFTKGYAFAFQLLGFYVLKTKHHIKRSFKNLMLISPIILMTKYGANVQI